MGCPAGTVGFGPLLRGSEDKPTCLTYHYTVPIGKCSLTRPRLEESPGSTFPSPYRDTDINFSTKIRTSTVGQPKVPCTRRRRFLDGSLKPFLLLIITPFLVKCEKKERKERRREEKKGKEKRTLVEKRDGERKGKGEVGTTQ